VRSKAFCGGRAGHTEDVKGYKTRKAWRGRRMRQALNLIDNWEEEDVVDPLSNDTGRRRCVVR